MESCGLGISDIVSFLEKDDALLRSLIYLEVLSRSSKDFKKALKKIFGGTWEFKILLVFLQGPSYKTQICQKLFPNDKDCHSKLSRGPIYRSFEYLLDKKIIVEKSKEGNKTLYELSAIYRPIIHSIINGANTHE